MIINMKKIGLLILLVMTIGLVSCEWPWQRPNSDVRFYMDGQEITADTVTVSLNTYQEIGVEAINSGEDWRFYWQQPPGYTMELHDGDKNFHWITDTYGNGRVLTAVFSMSFSDTLYHSGEVCRLRAISGDYQEVLFVAVR